MRDWLYNVGDFWIYALFGGSAVVCFLLAPIIGNRLGLTVPNKDRGQETDASHLGPFWHVAAAQEALVTLTAVVLAFSLVEVQDNLRKTEELVAKEAGQLNSMDRQLFRYGDPKVSQMRPLLWTYLESIVHDEWPALRAGSRSPRTTEAVQTLARAVFALDPQPGRQTTIYDKVLASLDEIADLREQRISASGLQLTREFWYLTFTLVAILIILSAMVEPVSYGMVSIAAQGVAIALLAALVFSTDSPFKGQISVSPTPLEHALTLMKGRT